MKTSKPRWLRPILCTAACILLTVLAVWDAVAHHSGRLVYPMEAYSFQMSDIPMLLAIILDSICILYLFLTAILSQKKRRTVTNRTRKLNPKLGILGLLGFLGFLGFWTWPVYRIYTPFCFFVFFGFFGFFYEGKMSNTFIDERYRENVARAQLDAYRIGISMIFLLLVFAGSRGTAAPEIGLLVLLAGISLVIALTLFLSMYLLYRYDQEERSGGILMAEFVCNLKKFRLQKGWTQEQLAEAVGVRRETIMRLEKAQYNPSLKLAVDISRAVEAAIEDIFVFP